MLRSCRGGGRREITKFSVCASLDIWNERAVYLFIYPHTHEYTRYETHYVISIICTCLHPCSFVKWHAFSYCEADYFLSMVLIYQMRYIPQIKDAYRNYYITLAVKKHSSFSINMFIFYHGSMEPSYLHTSLNIVQILWVFIDNHITSWWLTEFLALYVISLSLVFYG